MANEHKRPQDSGIHDALLYPLDIIDTKGGPVLRMLRPDSPLLPDFKNGFGEIYFSEVLPGAVKAWKKHRLQTQLFCVPMGKIKICLYDLRQDSPTFKVMRVLTLGRPDHYNLLRIPPGIWYGFQCLGSNPALICNCTDIPHDPEESERRSADDPDIPFQWENDKK